MFNQESQCCLSRTEIDQKAGTLLDRRGWQAAYPFGLSYTSYAYHDLQVEQAGQSLQVAAQITIPPVELCYYNVPQKKWALEPGSYQVQAGPSSDERALLKASIGLPSLD